MFISDTTNELL